MDVNAHKQETISQFHTMGNEQFGVQFPKLNFALDFWRLEPGKTREKGWQSGWSKSMGIKRNRKASWLDTSTYDDRESQ